MPLFTSSGLDLDVKNLVIFTSLIILFIVFHTILFSTRASTRDLVRYSGRRCTEILLILMKIWYDKVHCRSYVPSEKRRTAVAVSAVFTPAPVIAVDA